MNSFATARSNSPMTLFVLLALLTACSDEPSGGMPPSLEPDMSTDMSTERDMSTMPEDASMDLVVLLCAENEYVSEGLCEACPSGTTNASGDDPSGADTSCDVVSCEEDEFVRGNVCEVCPPGSTNMVGDDASASDTMCDGELCPSNRYVRQNECVPCPAGTLNDAGDDASGEDTSCDVILCEQDTFVSSNECVLCPAGTVNESGDDASGADSMCDAVLCEQDFYVEQNQCVACPQDTTNESGDDASSAETMCDDPCSEIFGVFCDQVEEIYVKSSNSEDGDKMGVSVAVDEGIVVIGADNEGSLLAPSDNGAARSGAVYVFGRDAQGQWEEQAILKASDVQPSAGFGSSVAISGERILVGAPFHSVDSPNALTETFAGAAYVFERDAQGQWMQRARLIASNYGGAMGSEQAWPSIEIV